jgi:hypothetical protein
LEVAERIGLNLKAPRSWHEQLHAAGFIDIHMKWFNWPIGPWAKDRKSKLLGKIAFMNFCDGIDTTIPVFMNVLGWKIEEAQVLIADVKKEWKEQKVHCYQQVCFCYAQKPPEIRQED